ncbi:hypothetical protein VCHC57A2_2029, partial [Vibrio cholerae HC-57A2]
MAKQIT